MVNITFSFVVFPTLGYASHDMHRSMHHVFVSLCRSSLFLPSCPLWVCAPSVETHGPCHDPTSFVGVPCVSLLVGLSRNVGAHEPRDVIPSNLLTSVFRSCLVSLRHNG
jgi:hypothetical protein